MPVGMPFFSICASSASIAGPRLHSSTKAAIFGSFFAANTAIGCSAATAQKVVPISVSARVVKTHSTSLLAVQFIRKTDSHAFGAADPVLLHQLHLLGPAGQVVERGEQLLGVRGDAQEVHRDLALLHQRAGAPAAALDHLLVGEHRLVDRVPVHHAGLLVGEALLEQAREEPLVPLVVVGLAGGELARPVDARSPGSAAATSCR